MHGLHSWWNLNSKVNGIFLSKTLNVLIVERYKYLGIVFYFNGNLKHATDYLYNKALKAFFSVKSKFNNFQEVPLKTCLKLFDSLLKPILRSTSYYKKLWNPCISTSYVVIFKLVDCQNYLNLCYNLKVSNIVLTNLTPTVLPGDYKLPKIMIFSKGKKDYSKYHFFSK
jgi:hypothetical protein